MSTLESGWTGVSGVVAQHATSHGNAHSPLRIKGDRSTALKPAAQVPFMGSMATMLFEARGSLVLWVGGSQTPTDTEWNAYVDALVRIARRSGRVRVMVFPGDSTPTPLQRKVLASGLYGLPQCGAVMTTSVVARSVTTVMRWLGAEIQAFSPSQRDRAAAFLEITSAEDEWLLATESKLRTLLMHEEPLMRSAS
jgi:hypothetical protein